MSPNDTAGVVSVKNNNASESVKIPPANSGVTEANESIESLKFRLSKALQQRDDVRTKLDQKQQADEDARLNKLEEDGKLKEMVTDLKSRLAKHKKRAEEFDAYEAKSRAEIMEKLNEEDQDIANGISTLGGLQKFYKRIQNSDTTRLATQAGTPSKNKVLDKPFEQLTSEEKKKNWSSIVDSFRK